MSLAFSPFIRKFNIRPVGSNVILKVLKDETGKIGNILVPETAQEGANKALVVAVGPGRIQSGHFIPNTLKENQKVLYPKYGGQTVNFKNEEYLIMNEEDIMAVIE